jgi:hypothetical protein
MRITKRQLRRIIKEEQQELEQHKPAPIDITDKPDIQAQLVRLVDAFRADMKGLWRQGSSANWGMPSETQQEHDAQVDRAADKLYEDIEEQLLGAEGKILLGEI